MPEEIRFYKTKEKYGCFSNFSRHPIGLKGKTWPTTEHYFQAQKFAGTPHEEEIRLASTPSKAAEMGRDRSRPLRVDWESVKNKIMLEAVYAKFTQHIDLQKILLSTGDADLIEDSPIDSYWGCGKDGKGQNWLGIILTTVRQQIGLNSGLPQGVA